MVHQMPMPPAVCNWTPSLYRVGTEIICTIAPPASVATMVDTECSQCHPFKLLPLAASEMWCWSGGRGILTELSLCYSIVYYYNGAQRYEQFLQVGRLYQALTLLGLALCLPSASVSLVFMVQYMFVYLRQRRRYMFLPVFFCLPVCLSVSKITQKRVHGFEWNVACRQIVQMPEPDCFLRYRTSAAMHNFITSEKSHIYVLYMKMPRICIAEFCYVGKIPHICIGRLLLQRGMVLKWSYSPQAVGTPLSEVHVVYRVPF